MRIARFVGSLLLALGTLTLPAQSRAQVAVGISVRIGPPVLPVYVQPICPGPGYIWVPGYWAYGPEGYFWVPGTWVLPPEVGLLWTPGYWTFEDDYYIWHEGYWGPTVGYYGGINYGFGYAGVGFYGGYWRGRTYYYNRAVTNVDVTIVRNTYNTTVVNNNTTVNRVSFNGGPGGTTARPTQVELAAARERHISMSSEQTRHQQLASTNRSLLASVNRGRPDIAASARPGQFNGRGTGERGRDANPNRPPDNRKETIRPENSAANGRRTFEDRPPSLRPPNAERVNPEMERKQQRELEKMHQKQDTEREKLQRQHAQEQEKLNQRRANAQRHQEAQERQQRQVEQLQRKHDQQAQKLQERQQKEVQKQEKRQPKPERPPQHQQ